MARRQQHRKKGRRRGRNPTCPTTGKRRFHDEKEAKAARRWQSDNGYTDGAELRIYRCPFCGGCHYTSQE